MKRSNTGPVPQFSTPKGVENQNCVIVFGHSTVIKKVLMQFSVSAERLIFSPDEARDVAHKLQQYADLADGKQVM